MRRELEFEQTAQRAQRLRLVVDQRRVFLENLVVVGARRELQLVDCFGVEQVVFAVAPPLILPAGIQRCAVDGAGRKRVPVPQADFFGYDVDAHALNLGRGPGEILVDDRVVEADGFKNLRAAIALDGRNPHLGHGFHDAFGDGLQIVLDRLFVFDVLENALANHVVQRLERQIRIDRARAVADQQRKVMNLARLTRFQYQPDPRARAFTDQMVVHAGQGQQGGNRRMVVVDAAIGQNEEVAALADGLACFGKQIVERLLKPLTAFVHVEKDRQGDRLEAGTVDVAQPLELLVAEDGTFQSNLVATFRLRIQQVPFRADGRVRRRDDFFADTINRRIGDLREQLLEIVVEQLRFVRQHCQRRVRAHGTERLHGVSGHGRQQDTQVFKRVAKRLLPK